MDVRILDSPQRAPAPAWAMLLLGWCVGAAWCEHAEARALASLSALAPSSLSAHAPAALSAPTLGLRAYAPGRGATWLPTTRELRTVEGIGAARAVDLARWFWAEAGSPGGPWQRLEDVPGVGPTLAARLRAQLAPGPRSPGHETERLDGAG